MAESWPRRRSGSRRRDLSDADWLPRKVARTPAGNTFLVWDAASKQCNPLIILQTAQLGTVLIVFLAHPEKFCIQHSIQLLSSIIDRLKNDRASFLTRYLQTPTALLAPRIKHPSFLALANRVFSCREIALSPPWSPTFLEPSATVEHPLAQTRLISVPSVCY